MIGNADSTFGVRLCLSLVPTSYLSSTQLNASSYVIVRYVASVVCLPVVFFAQEVPDGMSEKSRHRPERSEVGDHPPTLIATYGLPAST